MDSHTIGTTAHQNTRSLVATAIAALVPQSTQSMMVIMNNELDMVTSGWLSPIPA
jgi:hypothetical protein